MSIRTSLVLLLLLVLVAGYLAFSRLRPTPPSADDLQPPPWLLALSEEDILQVSIAYQGRSTPSSRGPRGAIGTLTTPIRPL